ncbi:dihydrofolate reductase family protein [uncultured Nocardioides sp.]|uniref:dihydrofolate reductase family protein n=1 Tax=uncultured Nocardioides sp. TaxID=198441 RepID=UPI0025E989AA|nr:dihydrofolate reductase family protein [uncultured Nocardioides sp.]
MARVIVSSIVSLDGFSEGPQQGVMDLPMDAAFDAYNLERISSADTVLLGARSYEFFGAYWPTVQHQPPAPVDADPMIAQALSDDCRAISRRYDEVDVLAVSDTLVLTEESPWRSRTTLVPRDDLADALAGRPGECIVFGSRVMVNGLLALGLVDELHLMVGARWLGGGTRYLDAQHDFELLDVRRFAGSDNVVHVCRPLANVSR